MKNILTIMTVSLFLLSACKSTEKKDTPWYLDTPQLWDDYLNAVEDARVATANEICHTLPAITTPGQNPRIEWMVEDGESRLVVVSLMSAADLKTWQDGEPASTGNQPLMWVTIPYDLEDHIRNSALCGDSLECYMRINQLIGLPPDSHCDQLVFFTVAPYSLSRPTPDPEVTDSEASLTFTNNASEHYRKWFAENTAFSYDSDTPYPWTRLGYTYDWNTKAADKVGPGEFIVHPGAQVRIERSTSIWRWYKENIISSHK